MKTNSNFIFQSLDAEMMVYDKLKDKVHVLNESATLILHAYQEGNTLSEIALKVKKHFSLGDKQNINKDISSALDQMKSLCLV